MMHGHPSVQHREHGSETIIADLGEDDVVHKEVGLIIILSETSLPCRQNRVPSAPPCHVCHMQICGAAGRTLHERERGTKLGAPAGIFALFLYKWLALDYWLALNCFCCPARVRRCPAPLPAKPTDKCQAVSCTRLQLGSNSSRVVAWVPFW